MDDIVTGNEHIHLLTQGLGNKILKLIMVVNETSELLDVQYRSFNVECEDNLYKLEVKLNY